MLIFQKPSAAEQPLPSRPYQGVRVKEPVKELLKRKRGSAQNAKVAPESMALFFPHQSLPSYSPTGQIYSETDLVTSSLPLMEEGALYSGWLTQPPPATLQPLTQWTTSPEYVSHEAVSCPYTADMFVQPVCPSYTLVGTSSVLTYTSQPLITNFAARSATSPAVVPHLDVMDQQAPLSYFPWTQPIPTLPATSLQYQPASMALSAPQFVPLPISGADPLPQVLEDTRKEMAPLTLEKLLQDDTNDTYGLNNSLPVEGL
ncbi:LOW QUALITY PROTEIN: POU domain class 2-associating factor 1 [Pituophis catenifer annectens]|uniref:LOW QUALITY PROTEIN: POU domain class 2-associating factor 1 n=1 Tax=Pituophis catenifer annectens TaxID=94852 RepID=UPI003991F63D